MALHRQIGPGLVDTAFRRKGLHRIELGAGLIEQAVLHHGDRQTALVLQCHMGVENLVGIGEESVQVGQRAGEGPCAVGAGDDHAIV